ncbi:MAG: Uncharacterised protein [Flavobacteriia bacterium]|nr:MAG: Uncharacterised protein [Flavobacteriia bacterium]
MACFLEQLFQIGAIETGHELLIGIMMVDPAAEPNPFGVLHECCPRITSCIAFVVADDVFEGSADAKIVAMVLVIGDVPPAQTGLGQVENEFLLIRTESIETGNLIPQDAQISELLSLPFEFFCCRGLVFFGYICFRAAARMQQKDS